MCVAPRCASRTRYSAIGSSGCRNHERAAAEDGSQEDLQAAVAADVVEGAPHRAGRGRGGIAPSASRTCDGPSSGPRGAGGEQHPLGVAGTESSRAASHESRERLHSLTTAIRAGARCERFAQPDVRREVRRAEDQPAGARRRARPAPARPSTDRAWRSDRPSATARPREAAARQIAQMRTAPRLTSRRRRQRAAASNRRHGLRRRVHRT